MASRPPPAAPLSSLTCDPKLLEAPIRANSLDLMTRDVQVVEFDERATMRAGNRFLFPAPSTERAIMSFEDWECVFKADGYKELALSISQYSQASLTVELDKERRKSGGSTSTKPAEPAPKASPRAPSTAPQRTTEG